MAQELGDRAVEAQACYSLGNTYTLLRDYSTAIEYHLRHLLIAQHLGDRIGEGRACWSLGNAHAALSHHEKALEYALKHLEISKEVSNSLMYIAHSNFALSMLLDIYQTLECKSKLAIFINNDNDYKL